MDFPVALLIPIIAVSIPLVAVTGRVIVQPIVEALTRLAEASRAGAADAPQVERRLAQMEARLESVDQVLSRLVDDYEFRRALELKAPPPVAPPAGAAGLPPGE